MTKTLVKLKKGHEGIAENGTGGCFARIKGACDAASHVAWLNGLGEDKERYAKGITNGDVRRNWIRGSGHIEKV